MIKQYHEMNKIISSFKQDDKTICHWGKQ